MSWVTFNVNKSGRRIPRGQVKFDWTIANTANRPLTGTVRYRHTNIGPGRIILTIATGVPVNAAGNYTINPVTYLPGFGVLILPAGTFTGGLYHELDRIVFTPVTSGSGTLSAIFSNPDPDDTCSWDAAVTTPLRGGKKKPPTKPRSRPAAYVVR